MNISTNLWSKIPYPKGLFHKIWSHIVYYASCCLFVQVVIYKLCFVIVVKADMVGTIILNPSALSSATLSIAEDEKIYHLVNYSNCTIIIVYHIGVI